MTTLFPIQQHTNCLLYTSSETAGAWTAVQYRVKATGEEADSAWAVSGEIPVVSASALAISGQDGDPVSYTHLDVYKRQGQERWGGAAVLLEIRELLRQLVRQRSRGDVRVTVIVQGNVIGNRAFADELGRTVGELSLIHI